MGVCRRRIVSVLNWRWNAAFAQPPSSAVIAWRVFERRSGNRTVGFALIVLSPEVAHQVTHGMCTEAVV